MRRWLISALLLTLVASAIGAELALALSLRANHCSCPIKGPCCEGSFCRMERARQESRECSMRSCGHGEAVAAVVRPPCVLLVVTPLVSRTAELHDFHHAALSPLRGITIVPEHPPRV